ncbi:4587_t:CDS:1 [Funneliformis geosporum]|uniref:10493_t:CDS:1 n=1 Tax=Funneliformis geosporum TaxID=1117311 RepID=A0A9W4SJ12_9GLOM|nr:4587_t:CDS:1 [Funneliformis geosporum]CAI2171647.1 10493_t:CDS:1 [Funneliformis geosporum]
MYNSLSSSCSTGFIGSSCYGLPVNNDTLEKIYCNIPATEVLEEMYKTLKLDIPPMYTFRQETISQKYFCSAGFIKIWYDTKETFSDKEGAKEAAARNLLKIIMSLEEHEKFLQVLREKLKKNQEANDDGGLSNFMKNLHLNIPKKKKNKNKHNPTVTGRPRRSKKSFDMQVNTPKLGKKHRKKLRKNQQAMAAINQNFNQESKPKKVQFDDRILILGEDVIPKSNRSNGIRSIMSQRRKNSTGTSSLYGAISNNSPETYQILVEEFAEKDKICVPASKLLDEFCTITNISKPRYEFCDDGYGNYVAEILVGEVKYKGERVFWYPDEAQECVAEIAFNVLYAKIDENTRMEFKRRIHHAFNMPKEMQTPLTISQQGYESQNHVPAYPNYSGNPCIQQPFGMTSQLPPPIYHNNPMEFTSQPIFNLPPTTLAAPFSTHHAPNLESVQQQTRQEIPVNIPTKRANRTDVSQQQKEPIAQYYPNILYKLVNENDWGIIEYQFSNTSKGYRCTCHARKLKFISNPCADKESAKNQAAKIAFLAFLEYGNSDENLV